MAIPFYNQGDQDIYAGGEHFIPQEQYRLGYTAPPSIANAPLQTAGITNTQAASPYIWPPQGGGGDFQGGGKYGHLDMSKTKDFVKNVYVDQGPKKGWQKQTVTGYYDTNTGNWKTKDNKNIQHAGLEVPGLFTSLMNKVSGKKFGEPRVGDIMGTFTKDPSGDIEEEEAIYNAAMHRNRINKIIQTGIYKDDYIPKGGDRHPDDPTDPTGDGTTGGTTLGTSTPAPGETWHPGVGGNGNTGNQGTDTPSGHAGDWGPGAAQGGRIGYNRGRVVNPGGYQGYPEIPEGFLEGLPNEDYHKMIEELMKQKKHEELMRELGPFQWAAEGGLIGYSDGGIVRLL